LIPLPTGEQQQITAGIQQEENEITELKNRLDAL